MPAPLFPELRVQHAGHTLRCIVNANNKDEAWEFDTGGKETVHKTPQSTAKSVVKWEGAALLINTIMSDKSKSYTQMDRWKLSRDGRTLTIRRQTVDLNGERESVLTYIRQ